MIQLIINGIVLPETRRDRYTAHTVDTDEIIAMASGRKVAEISNQVWRIEYSYDHWPPPLWDALHPIMARKSNLINVQFLPPTGHDLISETFFCTTPPKPTFAFERNDGQPLWHNISFVLEGANPVTGEVLPVGT